MGAGQPAVRCRALCVCPCTATGTDQPHRPCGVSCWVLGGPFPFMFYCAWLSVCCLALRSLSVCPPVRQFPGVFSQWACSLLSLCHSVSLLAACRLPVCVQRLCDHSSFHCSCRLSPALSAVKISCCLTGKMSPWFLCPCCCVCFPLTAF